MYVRKKNVLTMASGKRTGQIYLVQVTLSGSLVMLDLSGSGRKSSAVLDKIRFLECFHRNMG